LVGSHIVTTVYRYLLSRYAQTTGRYAVRARTWYKDEGAPAHFSRAMRAGLHNTYHDQWPIAWPQRWRGLNPPHLYLQGHKNLVYAAPVENEEALHHRIGDACQTSATTLAFF
jgi:hypothetical protein